MPFDPNSGEQFGGGGRFGFGNVIGGMGTAGIAGAFPTQGNQTTTGNSTQSGTSTNSGSQNSTNSTTPNLDESTLDFRNTLMNRYLSSMAPTDWNGYRLNGLQGINNNSQLQDQATQNILTSRGMNYSPVASTSMAQNQNQRFGQINQFENDLPLKQAAFEQGRMNDAGGFFSRIPYGQTQTGNQDYSGSSASNTTGTNTSSSRTTSGGGVGGFLGGLAGAAAKIFLGGR